jgi:RNase H-like domain found in reverse transcriptase/Reverse transcriptase (RNA-dependent DNA polymerase)/Integrase zinc binding domain/Integrase core domain
MDPAPAGHFNSQPFRPVFLQAPGRPPIPWTRWLAMFEDWLLAIGFPDTDANAQRKAALLRASLGTDGYRMYTSLATDPREPYADAVNRLNGHFGQSTSTFFNRAEFTRCQQRPGQSVTEYVAQLREIAARCEFPAEQLGERVRDQFVAWCSNDKIRERLLQESTTKSLDALLTLAITVERAAVEAPALTATPSPLETPVNRIGKQGGVNRYDRKPPRSFQPSSTTACGNCGQTGHIAKSDVCPARGRTCKACGKLGHYAGLCRSSASRGQTTVSQRRPAHQPGHRQYAATNHVLEDEESDYSETETDTIGSVCISTVQSTAPGTFKLVHCVISGSPINLVLDLGAKVSILSQSFYDTQLRKIAPLRQSNVTLRSYTGQSIAYLGCITASVQLPGRPTIDATFFVTRRGQSVMGVDLFDRLGGVIHLGSTSFVASDISIPISGMTSSLASSVSLQQFPVLLKPSGTLRGFVHQPKVDPTVLPVQQRFWHQPLAMREPIERELQRLQREGIIERIDTSPWLSNVVTARKKDGSVRLCVNLKEVNKALIPEKFPLPTMDELTEKVAGCKIFSKIDLLWGYLQLPLHQQSRYLTSFITHVGVFQYTSLPFGLATGPSAFQQVIRKILHGLPGCTNILDDILVYGQSMEEHDENLRRVLQRLQHYNATVRPDKCVIGAAEVDFNGHSISAAGVRPLQSNVDAILRIPTPADQRQLLRFVCTATYYMKFVPGFAKLCLPLRPLLKADSTWDWTSACQRAFDTIKQRIASPPILAHFDATADTVLTCDASATALGACLSQISNGVERPVGFASRLLTPTESKYSASEREALACLWASEKWHFFLYGRHYTLITDHSALRTLLTAGGTGHRPLRLHRWADRLNQYNFTVRYRAGRDNVVADCLSRAYPAAPPATRPTEKSAAEPDSEEDIDATIQTIFGSLATSVITMDTVASATAADLALATVRQYVIDGWPSDKRQIQPMVKPFYDIQSELSVTHDGRCIVRGCRTVIPASLQSIVMELAHEGHPGIVKMKQRCREAVWWPGIDKHLEQFVQACMPCIVSGKSIRPAPGPLQPVPLPAGPWKKLSLDIAGEFITAPHHQRFIIVAMDYYTKWPEAAVCGHATSAAVIDFLTGLFDHYGIVEEIATDNGVQFTSEEFTSFLQRLGIRHCRSALYSPQANAEVERFNRTIKSGLKAALAEGKSFLTGLRQVLAAYRTTPHSTTGVTPASLMLAFPIRTPLTMLAPPSSPQHQQTPQHQAIASRVQQRQQKMATEHNTKRRATTPTFAAGDYVRIQLPTRPHKLANTFSEPHRVARAKGNTVWLDNGQRWNVRRLIKHEQRPKLSATASSDKSVRQNSSCHAQSYDEETSLNDGPTFTFAATPDIIQPIGPRRSNRIRRQRDFGPFVKY